MGSQQPGRSRVPDGRSGLWRGHNLFRITTFFYAVVMFVMYRSTYERTWLAAVVLISMGLWTLFTVWRYSLRTGRTDTLVFIDQVVVTLLFCCNEFILTEYQMSEVQAPTVVTLWHATMVTAAGIQWGMVGGGISGSVASASYLIVRWDFDDVMAHDVVLLIGAGIMLGLASRTARRSSERLARALRAEAATAERERLARSIHDSVLQVLARVRRRGTELGGEAAELAKLAGEQEIALRTLVSVAPPSEDIDDGEMDLCAELHVLRTARINVSVPGTPVSLPRSTGTDLVAVVKEALANVDRHAGPDATAWVFLEDLGNEVVMSVRDDGPGIPSGRLAAAEREGRMGVAHSIRRRIENLGGTISLETAPGDGTEWEVRVPRPTNGKQAERRRGGVR